MIPGGNESLGPTFYEYHFFLIFGVSMTSSNDVINLSIFDDVIDDVIEVRTISKNIF